MRRTGAVLAVVLGVALFTRLAHALFCRADEAGSPPPVAGAPLDAGIACCQR